MKKIIILTFVAILIGVSTTTAEIVVLTKVRPFAYETNPLNIAAYSAAKQVIDSVMGTNNFSFPGIPYRTFNPQFIVNQPTLGNFLVIGMYYTPNYQLCAHVNNTGKMLGAIAGAVAGSLMSKKDSRKSGALIGATTGTLIGSIADLNSTNLLVDGAYIFKIKLSYRHSLDSLHFIPLWRCIAVEIKPLIKPKATTGADRVKSIKNITLRANEYWAKALELKEQADSLRNLE